MTRQKPTVRPPKATAPASERFGYVLYALFAGSQSKMALELRCSQSFLSRIVTGKKEPGSKLLTSLTKVSGINKHWVLTGQGQPFEPESEFAVPISTTLLPGPPATCRESLSGQSESVASAVYRDTAYIWVVPASNSAMGFQSGDRILMDADPRRWRNNLRVLDNKLCAVRRHKSSHKYIELCRVRVELIEGGNDIQLVGPTDIPEEYQLTETEKQAEAATGKHLRATILASGPQPTLVRDVIAVDDIVAIAIQLFRNF